MHKTRKENGGVFLLFDVYLPAASHGINEDKEFQMHDYSSSVGLMLSDFVRGSNKITKLRCTL